MGFPKSWGYPQIIQVIRLIRPWLRIERHGDWGFPLALSWVGLKRATTWIIVLAVLYRYRMIWIYIWICIYIYSIYCRYWCVTCYCMYIIYIWYSCRRPDFILADLLRCLNVSSPQMKFCFGLLRAVTWLWDCAGTGGNFVLWQSTQKRMLQDEFPMSGIGK